MSMKRISKYIDLADKIATQWGAATGFVSAGTIRCTLEWLDTYPSKATGRMIKNSEMDRKCDFYGTA